MLTTNRYFELIGLIRARSDDVIGVSRLRFGPRHQAFHLVGENRRDDIARELGNVHGAYKRVGLRDASHHRISGRCFLCDDGLEDRGLIIAGVWRQSCELLYLLSVAGVDVEAIGGVFDECAPRLGWQAIACQQLAER